MYFKCKVIKEKGDFTICKIGTHLQIIEQEMILQRDVQDAKKFGLSKGKQ